MDKQIVVYPCNGTLFRNKKKQTTDTYNNVDESWKHYAECKKPDTKEYLLYVSFYINSLKCKLI